MYETIPLTITLLQEEIKIQKHKTQLNALTGTNSQQSTLERLKIINIPGLWRSKNSISFAALFLIHFHSFSLSPPLSPSLSLFFPFSLSLSLSLSEKHTSTSTDLAAALADNTGLQERCVFRCLHVNGGKGCGREFISSTLGLREDVFRLCTCVYRVCTQALSSSGKVCSHLCIGLIWNWFRGLFWHLFRHWCGSQLCLR